MATTAPRWCWRAAPTAPADGVLKRKTAGWFYRLHNRLSKTQIPENVGDFRLMDRVVVDALKQLPERQRFMKGLFAWVGFRTAGIDYARALARMPASKILRLRAVEFRAGRRYQFHHRAFENLDLYRRASARSARFSMRSSSVVCTLLHGTDVPGYASLLVAILFFGSVQLMSIGLLGEYIGRIYIETKQRPTYLIRKTYGGDDGA